MKKLLVVLLGFLVSVACDSGDQQEVVYLESDSGVELDVRSADELCDNGGVVVRHQGNDVVICNGTDGDDGMNGENGQGVDGQDGQDGTNCTVEEVDNGLLVTCGDQSVRVSNGTNGSNGTDGADGEDGTDGLNGLDGVDGVDGQDGEKGDNGEQGLAGLNGADGDDCTIEDVPEGVLVTCGTESVLVEDGVDGVDGRSGAQGPQGLTGRSGSDGADGVDGQSAFMSVVPASKDECLNGGSVVTTGMTLADGGVETETIVVCNGLDGDSVVVSTRPAFWECPGLDWFDGDVVTFTTISGVDGGAVDSDVVVLCDGEDGRTPRVTVESADCEGLGGLTLTVNHVSHTVCNGAQGVQGEPGAGCSVTDVDGGAMVTCGDSGVLVEDGVDGVDGQDGADGVSCTVSDTDAGAVLTCSNGSVLIEDGVDGTDGVSCDALEVPGGLQLTCGDSEVVVPVDVNDCPGTWFHSPVFWWCKV